MFTTLTASTTRQVLALIYEQPSTAPEIRDEIDTSLQTVHEHLEKLENTDLIEPISVGYPDNETEMTVYVPVNEAIVLVTGRKPVYQRLREFI